MKMSYFREDEKRFSFGYKRLQGGQNERGHNTHEPDRDTTIAHYSPGSVNALGIQQFSSKRGVGERGYRKFVREGISMGSIWEKVRAQSILGRENFVERIEDYVRGYKDIPEIPKSQRYMNRPILEKLFEDEVIGDKKRRDKRIVEAVEGFGYSQKEVADHLGMHFSSINRIMRGK